MEDKWLYAGVFLSSAERMKLLHEVGKMVPDGWMIYANHSTAVFNDGDRANKAWYDWSVEHEGEERQLTVTHIGKSDKAIAVRVDGMMTRNSIPHITIAVSPDGKPVDSNMIKDWEPLENKFVINGKIKIIKKR